MKNTTTKKKSISTLKKFTSELFISKGYKPRMGVIKKCPVCGKDSYFRKSHSARIFCGKKCADINQLTGTTYKCTVCKKEYYRNNGQIKHRGKSKYCSKKCKGKSMSKLAKSQMPKIQKMKEKPNIAKLKKKLWIVFAKYIKLRDKNICISCGVYCEGYNAHAGHFIPKSIGGLSLYFDEDNVNCQCMRCNINLGGNLYEYGIALGEEKVARIKQKKLLTAKWGVYEYEKAIDKYTDLVRNIDL